MLIGTGETGGQIRDRMRVELEFHTLAAGGSRVALVHERTVGGRFLDLDIVPANQVDVGLIVEQSVEQPPLAPTS